MAGFINLLPSFNKLRVLGRKSSTFTRLPVSCKDVRRGPHNLQDRYFGVFPGSIKFTNRNEDQEKLQRHRTGKMFVQNDAKLRREGKSIPKNHHSYFENKRNGLSPSPRSCTVDGRENFVYHEELTLPLPSLSELLKPSMDTGELPSQQDFTERKTVRPSFIFDAARCKQIQDYIVEFRSRKTCAKQELLQLMGYITLITGLICLTPKWNLHIKKLFALETDLQGNVVIRKELREDICMWLHIISNWNGVLSPKISTDPQSLHTDASNFSYGGYFNGYWFSEQWETECNKWISSIQIPLYYMTVCELYPMVVSAILWGHLWKRQCIVFTCSIPYTEKVLNQQYLHSWHIGPLIRRLILLSAQHNFTFVSTHTSGGINTAANCLSQKDIENFRKLTPDAQEFPCKVPPLNEVLWDCSMI